MRRILILPALFILGSPLPAADDSSSQSDPPRSIRVSAQSEVNVVPNEVLINFTVDSLKDSLVDAKRENDTITKAAMQVIQEHGIERDHVKVTSVDLSPRYDDRYHKFLGYGVRRSFEIKLSEFDDVEELVSGLVEAGVHRVDEIDFRLRNQRQGQFEARKLAVEYAKEKATHLAGLLDMKVGRALHVSEEVEYNWDAGGFGGGFGGAGTVRNGTGPESTPLVRADPAPIAPPRGLRFVNFQEESPTAETPAKQTVDEEAATKAAPENAGDNELLLAPGLIQLNATVTITFELEPKK